MRVCHIIADGSPGGGPTAVQALATCMVAKGIEVSIVTQAGSYFFDQATKCGFQTFEIDFSRRERTIRASKQLAVILTAIGAKVAHGHGARSGLPIALIGHHRRPGFAYTIHGFHYKKKAFLSRLFFQRVEKFCTTRADSVITVSKADEALAQEDGLLTRPNAWNQIYNGVDVPADCFVSDQQRKYDIAFVARLHPQKNPLILPEILLSMRPNRPRMLIVGGGELEAVLRQKIQQAGLAEQVIFEGAMSRSDALKKIAQSRVLILPSLWEGLPISLVEAMRLRVPIVASRVSGNQEIIFEGQTGLLADPRNPVEFGRRISEFLNSPNLRESVAQNAERFAIQTFSIERQTLDHLKLYEKIAIR